MKAGLRNQAIMIEHDRRAAYADMQSPALYGVLVAGSRILARHYRC